MEAVEISPVSMVFCLVLIAVPVIISIYLKLNMTKNFLLAAGRMVLQLGLVGVFLEYVFEINNPFLNLGWLFLMIIVATFSSLKNSNLKIRKFLFPMFLSFASANTAVLFFVNAAIINLDNIFEAQYVIAVGGMILGNSLRGNIIGLNSFYNSVEKDSKTYLFRLACGASLSEACVIYIRESLRLALTPIMATMATIGIVSLPGMMTGQILGGSSPVTAIKYQVVIMLAIVAAMTMSLVLSVLFTMRAGFDDYGILKRDIFAK